MNDCPRHYTQKKAAYRSVSPDLTKTRPNRRVFVLEGQDVTVRRYTGLSVVYLNRRVFAFGGAER